MDIICALSQELEKKDDVSSSHWNKYHKNFSYNSGKLQGLEGFGTIRKPYYFFERPFHRFFQKKFLKLSSKSDFFESIMNDALNVTKLQNRALDLDVIRQCLTIDLLNNNNVFKKSDLAIVIGDGWGIMSSLLLKANLVKRVININLTKTLLVDMIYIKKAFGEKWFLRNSILIKCKKDLEKISAKKIIALEASNYQILSYVKKNLVLNLASFQEMDQNIINNYMKFLYKNSESFYFYLCNREEKMLPDGSVIKFNKYGLCDNDKILIDEYCKWHQDYYSFIPPFIHKFDGLHRHQLRLCNY